MIFGIKTKKDRLIDELKKEVERLKETRPRIVMREHNIETIESYYEIDFIDSEYINEEQILEFMLKDMSSELVPYLELGSCEDAIRGKKQYRGRIKVISKI